MISCEKDQLNWLLIAAAEIKLELMNDGIQVRSLLIFFNKEFVVMADYLAVVSLAYSVVIAIGFNKKGQGEINQPQRFEGQI